MSEARQVQQGEALVYLPCFWQNAPLHQTENIFKVSQKLVCEKWYNCSHALHLKKAPFTSGWKYCQGSTKTCLWKVHNCVWKIPPLHQAENIFEVAQIPCEKWLSLFTDKFFYATLASEKLPKFTCLASRKYW